MYELKGKPKSTKCIIDGCEREKLPGISYCSQCRSNVRKVRRERKAAASQAKQLR